MRAVVTCIVLCTAACGSRSYEAADAVGSIDGPICDDADQDGYGTGAGCAGPDCRDDDPAVHDCGCDEDPTRPDCACESGALPTPCFEGPAEVAGVGLCTAGIRVCRNGRWSACEGQVLPEVEECDYEDEDCDGEVDDGVLGECGDCDRDCELLRFGRDGDPFPAAEALVEHDDQSVELDGAASAMLSILFDESANAPCPLVYGPVDVGAAIPDGASISIELRTAYTPESLEPAEWRSILVLPGGELPATLYDRGEERWWTYVEIRITLTAAPGGASPLLEWLTIGRRYLSCTFE